MTGFDWQALLKAGVQGAGLRPHELWQLTPHELSIVLGADAIDPPMTRARLAEIEAQYRDIGGKR